MGVCPQALEHSLRIIQPVDGQQDSSSLVPRDPLRIVLSRSLVALQQIRVLLGRDADGEGFQTDGTASHRNLVDFAFHAENPKQRSAELLQMPVRLKSKQICP